MSKEFLLKCIRGEASEKEMLRLKIWLESDREHIRFYAGLKNLWVASTVKDSVITETDIPYIQKIIAKTVTPSVSKPRNRKLTYNTLIAVAAIALLLLSIGGIPYLVKKINAPDYIEIFVPKGERSEISLCDGSKIFINSGSTLRYPRKFGRHSREITLNGEAYFLVAPNKAVPFIVKTSHFSVKVLGTEFNIKAHDEDNLVTATLDKGSIELTRKESQSALRLKPGEEYLLRKDNNRSAIQLVDNQQNWLNNFIVVEHLNINEFCRMLERRFDVSISIDPVIDRQFEYNGHFKSDKNIEEILDIMAKASPIRYSKTGDLIIIQKK